MTIEDIWRDVRTLEIRRRRALGRAGRLAEIERRMRAVEEFAKRYQAETATSLGKMTPLHRMDSGDPVRE
jgi:hypothetical protein